MKGAKEMCKCLYICRNKELARPLQVRGKDMPHVEDFKYLRVLWTSDGKKDGDLGSRLGQSAAVMRSLYCIYGCGVS